MKWMLIMLLAATPTWAATPPQKQEAPAIEVIADNLEISPNDGHAIFTGNVQVDHGTMNMTALKLEIFYAKSGVDQPKGGVEKVVATKNVVVNFGEDNAQGEKAVYRPEENKIHLSGNVIMTRGENMLTGENLSYDLTTGQLKLDAGTGKQIRARVLPGQLTPKN